MTTPLIETLIQAENATRRAVLDAKDALSHAEIAVNKARDAVAEAEDAATLIGAVLRSLSEGGIVTEHGVLHAGVVVK
jgi:hypothetical protein